MRSLRSFSPAQRCAITLPQRRGRAAWFPFVLDRLIAAGCEDSKSSSGDHPSLSGRLSSPKTRLLPWSLYDLVKPVKGCILHRLVCSLGFTHNELTGTEKLREHDVLRLVGELIIKARIGDRQDAADFLAVFHQFPSA